jgi:predicted AlkP superfamily phosphohydrolase/phosphomutase
MLHGAVFSKSAPLAAGGKMLNRKNKKKLALIGLDGVSYDLVKELTQSGVMPNMEKLIKNKGLVRTSAPLPEISPVSWMSMMAGMNPGQHGENEYNQLREEIKRRFLELEIDNQRVLAHVP